MVDNRPLWRGIFWAFIFQGLFLLFLIPACAEDIPRETLIVGGVLAAEGCGEGTRGMQMIANVVQNRAKAWNKTPYEIVTQKNQFYGYTAFNRERLFRQCKKVALDLAINIEHLVDLTGGAMYFRQPGEPLYSWHGEETVRYGGHIFHREAKK